MMKFLTTLCLVLLAACAAPAPTAPEAPAFAPSFWSGTVNYATNVVPSTGWLSPGTATIVRYRVTCPVAWPFTGCDLTGDAAGRGFARENVTDLTIDVPRPASGEVAFSVSARARRVNGLLTGATQKFRWRYVEPLANSFGPNSGVPAPDAPPLTIVRVLP